VTLLGVSPVFGATNSHGMVPELVATAKKFSRLASSVLVIEI
jgi:hypothetical protein